MLNIIMRSVQRRTTSTISTSTALGQNAATLSANPSVNQNVNISLAAPTPAPTTPTYPTAEAHTCMTSSAECVQSRDVNIDESPYNDVQPLNEDKASVIYRVRESCDPMTSVYQKLMNVYKNALLDDPQLTLNLIDQSGKIILNGSDLTELLAVMCNVESSHVKINYYLDEEPGCCGTIKKLSPIKEIDSIQICKSGVWLDLIINFNGIYNKINDEFKISLKRVLVKQAITYP